MAATAALWAEDNAKRIKITDITAPKTADANGYLDARVALSSLMEATKGCVMSVAYQNLSDGSKFFVYEEFVDAAAQKASQSEVAKFENELMSKFPNLKQTFAFMDVVEQENDKTDFIIAVEIKVDASIIEDFKARTKYLRDNSNNERNTLVYELYQDKSDATKFFLFERYQSRDNHKYHASQKYFNDWAKYCKDMGAKVVRNAKKYDVSFIK